MTIARCILLVAWLAASWIPFETVRAADSTSNAEAAPDSSIDDLGPSTGVPWNPPEIVQGSETWESVLRFPSQLVLVPISVGAEVLQSALVALGNQVVLPQAILYEVYQRYGIGFGAASLGERTGLGGSMTIEPPFARPHLAVELSGSTNKYSRVRVRAGTPSLFAEYQHDWRPREQFFGLGTASRETDVSAYSARFLELDLRAERAWSPRHRGAPRARVRAWTGMRDLIVHRGRDIEDPSFETVFPGLAGSLLDERVSHMVYGLGASYDGRAGAPHWSHGWRAAFGVERFDKPIGDLALRDPSTSAIAFTRLTYEVETAVSFFRDPRTLRLMVRAIDVRPGAGTGVLQLPDLSVLGGGRGLAGFEPGRFHDLDLLLGELSYVFPLSKHLELDVHTEWGGVYGDLFEDARIDGLQKSFGVGLRPRLETMPLGSLGLDWCREGARLRFSVGGVE